MRLIDFSARQVPPDAIKAANYDGVIAYVSESRPGTNFGAKPITRDYADALSAVGLQIVSNYQYGKPGGSAPSDFTRGFDGGVADAQTAMRLHTAAGGPGSAPIFFSVDEDIDLQRWNSVAVQWFRGINSVLGVDRTGIYGHSRVCAWAIEDGVVGSSTTAGRRWVWQTKAWSYGQREPAAVLYQDVIDTASQPGPQVADTTVDENEVLADDFGQWRLDRPAPAAVAGPDFEEHTEPQSPYCGPRREGARVLWFVLHTEQGSSRSAEDLAHYLCQNADEVSYHYTVDNAGQLYNIIDTDNYANSVFEPGNSESINLCFAGSFVSWSPQEWFDRMRYGIDVAAYVAVRDARRYGLQPRVISPADAGNGETGITDHNGVRIATGQGTHTDVGPNFPWDYFRQKLAEYAGEVTTAAAMTYSGPSQIIAQGTTSRPVAMIQDRLNRVADAGLLTDGEFAECTQRAVTAFQESRGLVADGQVGPRTWTELFSDRDRMTKALRSGFRMPVPEALVAVTPIDPGPVMGSSTKIKDVTGPGGLTDQFSMAATDLGVMARTPSGRILAVFGDTFLDPWVGGRDWRAPVALFSDTKNLDEGIVWSEAAGGDPSYARQLWPYPHHIASGDTTVLPSDVMTIGDAMYLHASAHFPFGNVGFTEIWKSTDDGHTWFRPGPRFDGGIHNGLAQLWAWDVGDDGWVYVMSTAFRIARDAPIILRRVPADRLTDPSAYEGWGFGANGWAWGNEPTPVLDGGYGELCLRRIQGQWVFVVFNNFEYRIEVRVFPDVTNNLYDVPMNIPIHGTDWGQEGGDAVAQLYGPSIVPGSRLDGGFHLFVSQWKAPGPWPYHVMQFKIPVPDVPSVQAFQRTIAASADGGRKRRSATGNGQSKRAPARARSRR
jgi:N-acetyl-anhydromuramyl-L-alanine amidase AmpD